MPNWCTNSLKISVDNVSSELLTYLKDIFDVDKTEYVTMNNKIVPIDEGNYCLSYAIDNWGTKWEVQDQGADFSYNEEDNHIEISFYYDTAWSPNIPVTQTLLNKINDLGGKVICFEHTFSETGCGFYGIFSDCGYQDYNMDAYYLLKEGYIDDVYEINKRTEKIITLKDVEGMFLIRSSIKVDLNYFDEVIEAEEIYCFSETHGEVTLTKIDDLYIPNHSL